MWHGPGFQFQGGKSTAVIVPSGADSDHYGEGEKNQNGTHNEMRADTVRFRLSGAVSKSEYPEVADTCDPEQHHRKETQCGPTRRTSPRARGRRRNRSHRIIFGIHLIPAH